MKHRKKAVSQAIKSKSKPNGFAPVKPKHGGNVDIRLAAFKKHLESQDNHTL